MGHRHEAHGLFEIRITGQCNTHHVWPPLDHLLEQRGTIHLWHALVRDDHVEWPLLHCFDRVASAVDEFHRPLVAQPVQPHAQSIEELRLVVYEQDPFHDGLATARPLRGSTRVNRDPTPVSLCSSMRPPCFSTIDRVIASPWPVPLPTSFVVKKGSKMRSRILSGMPQPLSCTCTRTNPSSASVVMMMRPL